MNELSFTRTQRIRRPRLPADPGDRAVASLRRGLGPPGHLLVRASFNARGCRSGQRHRGGCRPSPSFADGLQVQRVSPRRASANADSAARGLRSARREGGPDRATTRHLFTGQFADCVRGVCRLASAGATTGLEIACWAITRRVDKARADDARARSRPSSKIRARRLDDLLFTSSGSGCATTPSTTARASAGPIWVTPRPGRAIARGAGDQGQLARAAAKLGSRPVVGFTGSSIWHTVAMSRRCPSMIEQGYRTSPNGWNPIRTSRRAVCGSARVHPSDVAYDYWTTVRPGGDRGTARHSDSLRPEPLRWQDLDPVGFLWTSATCIYTWTARSAVKQLNGATAGWVAPALPIPVAGGTSCRRPRRRSVGADLSDAQFIAYDGPSGRVGRRRMIGRRCARRRWRSFGQAPAIRSRHAAFDAAFNSQRWSGPAACLRASSIVG